MTTPHDERYALVTAIGRLNKHLEQYHSSRSAVERLTAQIEEAHDAAASALAAVQDDLAYIEQRFGQIEVYDAPLASFFTIERMRALSQWLGEQPPLEAIKWEHKGDDDGT